MKKEIILVGGGGHCKSCIDVIESTNRYTIKGIIDLPSEKEKLTLGYKVIGSDDDLPFFARKGYNFLITMGNLGNNKRRKVLFQLIKQNGGKLPVIKSSNAIISKHSIINDGTIVMHNAIINAGAIVGSNTIVNTNALVEHDSNIGNNCHLSTNVVVNGSCTLSDDVFIGSNAVLKHGINIGEGVIVGAGSVVVKNLHSKGVYVGIPSKKIKND